MVAETHVRAEGAFPPGVGGTIRGGAALTKIRAGASLIQRILVADFTRPWPRRRHQERSGPTFLRTGRDSPSEIVGADAATITADWPV
jgi:hypothetical protein